MQQQFLTAFNNNISYSTTARKKDKKTNSIIDFINATYQGELSPSQELQGPGIIIDDEFNFILCENFQSSKLNGEVIVKLANQLTIWGKWKNNLPERLASLQIGSYNIYVPYSNQQAGRPRRPKKCLIQSKNKGKMYLARVQRNPQQYNNKRQYSIVIQKAKPLTQSSISQSSQFIENILQPKNLSFKHYLDYLHQSVRILSRTEQQNGFFFTINDIAERKSIDSYSEKGLKLGLLVDKNKYCTKSVGIFNQDQDIQKEMHRLNGLGLSRTTNSEVLVGIFKSDMIVKDYSYQTHPDVLQKNYSKNLNGSYAKQMLTHEHMKSLSYIHSYLYFPQIKKLVNLAIEMHKYVDMFERLSQQQQTESSELDESQQDRQQKAQKYSNQSRVNNKFVSNVQESSESIIDQYKDFRVNIVRREEMRLKQDENVEQNRQHKGNMGKKPGFILHRSPTPNKNSRGVSSSKSRSPSANANKKIYHDKTPPRHQNKWRI